jgi:hypothetical protein
VQSPVVGAVLSALPLAVPHEPFTAERATVAEHCAVLLLPAQDQRHGPLPDTAEAVPVLQSPVVGALLTATPLAVPQEPVGFCCCCAQAGVARNERQNATRKIVLIIVASQLSVCFVERRQIVERFSGFPKSMNEWFQRRRVEEYDQVFWKRGE